MTVVVVAEPGQVIVTEADPDVIVTERETSAIVTEAPAPENVIVTETQPTAVVVQGLGLTGPQGPNNLFIQPDPPVTDLARYYWIQTFPDGSASLWVEDGAP